MPDNMCFFLCCDFDDKSCEHGYQDDVRAYVSVCRDWNIPAYVERSRSGNGAHVWILFDEPIKAQSARRLGNAILTEAMDREGRMSFKSYDRFFPNQDFMPDGGFGNLVALPLQGHARKNGNSVFVDDNFIPYPDQWAYLQQMMKTPLAQVDSTLSLHTNQEPLGALSKTSESAPWERPKPRPMKSGDFPKTIAITRSNGLYIPMDGLSAKVVNHLKRMAAFKNPEFYAKLGMRLPTFNIPRIISCSEIVDDYLWLPRGCEESVFDFFNENGVNLTIKDKNNPGQSIDATFLGELRPEQAAAIEELSKHRCGTIYAATAFGKTVTGIAMIACKKVNTLILVHTKALLDQWRERLEQYLEVDFEPEELPKGRGRRKKFKKFGALFSIENSLNGKIDIALLQSCISDNEVKPFVRNYGMVIVDECHHAPAVSFERVLKEVNAKWVYGLTATPIRKDGHQPIIFMQCGEIRYTADTKAQQEQQTFHRLLISRFTTYRNISDDNGYTAIAQSLSEDDTRNRLILDDVRKVLGEGRSPIILTGLTSHVDYLAEECRKICPNVIRLVGNDSAKAKRQEMERLKSIPDTEPLVVVATGKYVGEGFDLPRLDTLMLALPVSWKGLIAQYTGRLHRDYPSKSEVRIYDYIDLRVPICDSMYKKRLHGYKAVGYSVVVSNEGIFAEPTAETIFDSENFERPFNADLSSAKRSIVISTNRVSWNRTPKIIDLLTVCMLRGVSVTIVIRETDHREAELQSMGFHIIHRSDNKMNCAVIDQSLGWYGSVNLIGRSLADTNVIRMPSSDLANALLETLNIV
ncbi:DEAD/DEAH box helicase family protein [uncultured Duncaniella sp.]|uniref:TOTE conflict system archaeo-eukaryotic primase domain-containing protein n=1 Tax=uncultured Duncaniella sp. TaxID=2768039 RepID=UPI0026098965|nr:DEAD/DEAH box helicase family protein [uncultured Duncaniella sp.]